jgi:hypothetical protein
MAKTEITKPETDCAATIERLTAQLAEKTKETEILQRENAALKAKLEKTDVSKTEPVLGKDVLEIVAIPSDGVPPPPDLIFDGVRYKKKEIDGFAYFRVPFKDAETLLTDTSAMKFLLTAPAEKLILKRRVGMAVEDVEVFPYVMDKTSGGRPIWKKIIIEESK